VLVVVGVMVWRARVAGTGTADTSSGLQFDILA
jgi:hypothetical protein